MSAAIGELVLYHDASSGASIIATVTARADHDGDTDLDIGTNLFAYDVKEGLGPHTYERLTSTPTWTVETCPIIGTRYRSCDPCPHCTQNHKAAS